MANSRSSTVLTMNRVSKLLNMAGKSVWSLKETALRNEGIFFQFFVFSLLGRVLLGIPSYMISESAS